MKFTDYNDYMEQRTALLNKAQGLLETSDLGEEYQNAKKAVTDLDTEYETYANEKANLNAMAGTQKAKVDVMALGASGGESYCANEDLYNTVEYRKAFMNHVLKGAAIPGEFMNANETTKTTDIGAVIPTTVLEKIIEKMETMGMILPLVTKTSYKGGVSIPKSSVKPVATWVAEGKGSDKQKKTTDGTVTFAYHKLRCAVSTTLETDTMALPVFETTLIKNVSEAMTKAKEQAIINGDGAGKPKGILAETVATGRNIDLGADGAVTYQTLIDAEAAVPLAYEAKASWFMTKPTFMAFAGMTDDAGQPIARVNYGITGSPERTLLGRKVVLNEYMVSVNATVTKATVVAFIFNPEDYALNENLSMAIKRYEDNETDDIVTKAVALVDGKVIDNGSLVTITKKA